MTFGFWCIPHTVYPKKYAHVFALLCFVVVIHWLIFPYPSGLLHWHCGNLTIAPAPAKQPWWIWINTSCEFIINDCITTTKQSTTKPCAYFLGYTVPYLQQRRWRWLSDYIQLFYMDVIFLSMISIKGSLMCLFFYVLQLYGNRYRAIELPGKHPNLVKAAGNVIGQPTDYSNFLRYLALYSSKGKTRPHEVSKSQYWMPKHSYRLDIWQAARQQRLSRRLLYFWAIRNFLT